MRRILAFFSAVSGLGAVMVATVPETRAQRDVQMLAPDEAQAELQRAEREGQRAEARAARFARDAEAATQAAEKTAREAAALAARVQASEARITAARARFTLAQTEREALSKRLAARRQPLVRLTGALQTTARRPLALSALQPGSLKELVYVRAVLDAAVPEIRQRTATLREELEQGRELERRAARALESLRSGEVELQTRRTELEQLEARQRLASREARGNAAREGERALALAEQARDLDGLIDQIDDAAQLRRDLAALPGPIMRPDNIGASLGSGTDLISTPTPSPQGARITGFQLPVQGRTIAGFGELRESGLRSTSLELAPQAGAQVVAPASGRVAFAGPYRGFDRIVIIEHDGGWTSLVTGLDRISAQVGDTVIAGAPLGSAGQDQPSITIELRKDGEPVNPLNYLG